MSGCSFLIRISSDILIRSSWTWRTDQRLTLGPSSHYNEEACRAYLGRIKCPTLAILAKTGHWTRNLKPMLDSRIDLVRKATGDLVIEIVDSTHHLHMEDPVTTARLLVEFMKTRLDVLDRPKKKVQAQAARL